MYPFVEGMRPSLRACVSRTLLQKGILIRPGAELLCLLISESVLDAAVCCVVAAKTGTKQ